MQITIIRIGYSIKQVFIGSPTKQIQDWVDDLNKNPLLDEEVTIEEKYVNKSIYDLCNFLGL